MTEQSSRELACSFARTAAEAFRDQGEYFRALPDDAWDGPTGCADWNMRVLAGHIVGEAVWFPHLVRTVTEGVAPLPDELWEQLKRLPGDEIGARMEESAGTLVSVVDAATPDDVEQPVDLGFAKLPLWQAVYISMFEASFHNWDARACRERDAKIPTPWAQQLAIFAPEFGPTVAHLDATTGAEGRYLLEVGDGVGPVTITITDGAVNFERGPAVDPDLTLHLTADQYMRLIAGRFLLAPAIENGAVAVEGDSSRAAALNRVFRGVAN